MLASVIPQILQLQFLTFFLGPFWPMNFASKLVLFDLIMRCEYFLRAHLFYCFHSQGERFDVSQRRKPKNYNFQFSYFCDLLQAHNDGCNIRSVRVSLDY